MYFTGFFVPAHGCQTHGSVYEIGFVVQVREIKLVPKFVLQARKGF
jgi:hypothetical protein